MTVEIEVDVSHRAGSSAEIRSSAVYPLLAIDSLRVVPCIFAFPDVIIEVNAEIEKKHLVIRNL